MWKQLSFSHILKYLGTQQEHLSFKKIENFFEKNEVKIQDNKELKKIHITTFLQYKWIILAFIISITLLKLVGPVIIHQLISEFDLLINKKSSWVGVGVWSLVMVFSQILHTFIGQHYIYRVTTICQSVSKKMNKMIFSQILSKKTHLSEGELINRSIQDSENASNLLWISTEFILSLLTILLSSLCLLLYLGPSAIIPLILLFTIFPLGRMYARRFSRLQSVIQKNKDDRLDTLSNYLSDMNAVKSFGWEDAVFKNIKKPRRIEQYFWDKLIKLKALSTISFLLINVMVASLAFGLYVFNGGNLTAELAFTCLCYFGFLEPALKQISKIANDFAGALTANQRIQRLISEPVSGSEGEEADLYQEIINAQSIAIVGRLGGGKSSLLNRLIPLFKDKALGYQPQDPYIFESALLDNLTFGKSISKEAINKALDYTFLNTDLTFSERGLRTRLKSRGSDLSFAQKQKIVLARTYCLNPDVLLLDEPCSSFDKRSVDSVFNDLIFGEWKNKKKIIVTSQMRHLPRFDKLFFIDSQRNLHIGSYQNLLENEEFFSLVHSDGENDDMLIRDYQKYEMQEDDSTEQDEELSPKEITPSLYYYYLRAMHAFKGRKRVFGTLSLLVLSALGVAFLPIYQNVYITKWTEQSGGYSWALGYLGIGSLLAIVAGIQNFIWSQKTFKAATNIHDSVLTSVLGNYISFFDIYPGSKLLNVFSKDLDTIEKDLTFYLEDAFISFLHTATSLMVLMVTLPIIIFVLVPVAFIFGKFIGLYRKNLCMLKNLIAEARIPRIRSLSESIEGRDVIRAFNAQRFFLARMNKGLNQYQDAISFQTVLSRWFVIKISCLGSVISLSVAAYACYYSSLGMVGKGLVSMMILYSFKFWENLCWSVKSVNEADSQMVFVQKFNELSTIKVEKKYGEKTLNQGQMSFEDVIFSSKDNVFNSIDSLNERIGSGEKVGVHTMSDVSRSAFLGMITGVKRIKSGRIQIGDFDINDEFNRSSYISFVSDKTDLFRGSVRSNLDPLGRKTESEMEEVLDLLGLNLKLNQRILSGGGNLSGGERKLMCLARALIADTSILIIEESCPASVDITYRMALERVFDMTSKTILLISNDRKNLKKCDRIFCIDHRINDVTLSVA